MKVSDIAAVLERIAPPSLAATWDNVGLLVGDPEATISRLLLTVDYTRNVARECEAAGCDMVLAYHPPIFDGLKKIVAGSLVYDAIRAGRAIYSPHTSLDVVAGGTNDVLADALGLQERSPLRPLDAKLGSSSDAMGFGRVGTITRRERRWVVDRIKAALGLSDVLVAGTLEGDVTRAAVCAGSCGDLLKDAIAAGAQLYLTGELRHHDALLAADAGMTVVCTMHSNSERAALRTLLPRIQRELPDLPLQFSTVDVDPFRVA